ncbi:MAG: hypothetical protein IBGAMO2_860009 [Arenicellales bacterium IbO2]|nr:MAG: hypothetical protein IBGAMO2_860009 [Arenicellales bacterium IbO2]
MYVSLITSSSNPLINFKCSRRFFILICLQHVTLWEQTQRTSKVSRNLLCSESSHG